LIERTTLEKAKKKEHNKNNSVPLRKKAYEQKLSLSLLNYIDEQIEFYLRF